MILQVKDLPHRGGIYKLNYPNGKIYIGFTNDLKRRTSEHNNNYHDYLPDCDKAIKELGQFTEIEILEFVDDFSLLEEKEKYWIKYYNANNPDIGYNKNEGGNNAHYYGEENSKSVLSNEQVLDIRKRRFFGERKCDVYKDYSNISFSTFEHIWLGRGYNNIGQEYMIPSGEKTRQEYSSNANRGEKNNKAKLTEEKVKEIRKRYDNGEPVLSIAKDFPEVNTNSIRRVVKRETWKHVI